MRGLTEAERAILSACTRFESVEVVDTAPIDALESVGRVTVRRAGWPPFQTYVEMTTTGALALLVCVP